ncbi:DUF1440 domain-containing protein [Helicobacter jaachi]|uniref:DUF1440 domain-containing protein n=1 Tax=Helicobacter jaachi TaxID=1677920 RepID=A0A4U8TAL0_9HELI|nr:YagU family protein [Helicobacter jaachi]TLD96920.1 DUF1440 domain-containing protein [Helicobacter jaachi]
MQTTPKSARRYGLAALIGVIAGVFSAIVKWGWEVPFPPRNPSVPWPVDAVDALGAPLRTTPPNIFLEQIGLGNMIDWSYTFSGISLPLGTFMVHVGFAVVFAVAYCVIAEVYPRIKMWQGAVFGIFVYLFAHVIVMPLIAEVPPLSQIPLDEHISEFFGHIVWLWAIEIVRRDLRNRITKQSDPEFCK